MVVKIESNIHYARGITMKWVTRGGIHIRSLATGQHSSKETSQWWGTVGDTVCDSTDPGLEPQTFRTYSNVLTTELIPIYFSNVHVS